MYADPRLQPPMAITVPTSTALPTAIAYCRVSTSKQDLSMDQQQRAAEQWCAANGFELASYLIDSDVSGAMPLLKRPEGRQLIGRARAMQAQVVVSTYIDRLFRDTLDGLRCMREVFPVHGLRVMLVNEAMDLSTPAGRLMATTRLAAAEFERELIADRTRRTSQRLQNDGRVYGHVPYGCISVDGHLQRLPDQWGTRDVIVGMLKTQSIRDVQAALRKQRLRSPSGSLGWATSTLARLLSTHDRLALLPLHAGDDAGAARGALEAGVSAR